MEVCAASGTRQALLYVLGLAGWDGRREDGEDREEEGEQEENVGVHVGECAGVGVEVYRRYSEDLEDTTEAI